MNSILALTSKPRLFGYIPVFKPKGLPLPQLLRTIDDDIYFTLRHNNVGHGIVLFQYARHLPEFASGVVTFLMGSSNQRKKAFYFADSMYRMTVEFGVCRRGGTIQGEVLSREDVYLDEGQIQDATRSFLGETMQVHGSKEMMFRDHLTDPSETISIYRRIQEIRSNEKDEKQTHLVQKYPLYKAPRCVECYKITLVEYNKPYATFEVICQSKFSVIKFATDLALSLNTKGSVIEMTRTKEAIMDIADLRLLQIHEANLEYYVNRKLSWHQEYEDYLSSLISETEVSQYRVIL